MASKAFERFLFSLLIPWKIIYIRKYLSTGSRKEEELYLSGVCSEVLNKVKIEREKNRERNNE